MNSLRAGALLYKGFSNCNELKQIKSSIIHWVICSKYLEVVDPGVDSILESVCQLWKFKIARIIIMNAVSLGVLIFKESSNNNLTL